MARRTKTSAAHVLDLPVRSRLAWYVHRRPGVRLERIWRALRVSRGTIQHHLLVLERVGAVQVVRAHGATRYFPREGEGCDVGSISYLLHHRVLEFASTLHEHPGWCQQDFTMALGMRRKTFRRYADRLTALELLEERRDKFRKRYYATPRLERLLAFVQDWDDPGLDDCGVPSYEEPGGPPP